MLANWWNSADVVGKLATYLTYGTALLALVAAYVSNHYSNLKDRESAATLQRLQQDGRQLAGRALTEEQCTRFIEHLRDTEKHPVTIGYAVEDTEVVTFANQLRGLLNRAGFGFPWQATLNGEDVQRLQMAENLLRPQSVMIFANAWFQGGDWMTAIKEAFDTIGLPAGISMVKELPEGTVVVFVSTKPRE